MKRPYELLYFRTTYSALPTLGLDVDYCVVGQGGVASCTGVEDPEELRELNEQLYEPGKAQHGDYLEAPLFVRGRSSELDRLGFGEDDQFSYTFYITNRAHLYSPLLVPGLFLEFAEPRERQRGYSRCDARLGQRRYGVLGLEGRGGGEGGPKEARGGPKDNLRSFASEAWKATKVLRLYEAATAPGGPDELTILDHLNTQMLIERGLELSLTTPLGRRDAALAWVAQTVRDVVANECHPELYQGGHRYYQGWGFRSLLGATYLQTMGLMTATGEVRKCKGPGCNKVITFERPEPSPEGLWQKGYRKPYKTRADKEFCSSNCKAKWHYHNVAKPRRESEGARL
jgi:hypothetical protein